MSRANRLKPPSAENTAFLASCVPMSALEESVPNGCTAEICLCGSVNGVASLPTNVTGYYCSTVYQCGYHLPYPDACSTCAAVMRKRAWREVQSVLRDGATLKARPTKHLAHQRNEISIFYSTAGRARLDDKQRDTTYTRQIPTRYVRTLRRGATVYDCDTESADRIFLAAPIPAFAQISSIG